MTTPEVDGPAWQRAQSGTTGRTTPPPYLSRDLVRGAARLALWPQISVGSTILGDRGAWKYAIPRASHAELVEMLLALEARLLGATPAGDERLTKRLEEVGLETDVRPCIHGDIEGVPLVDAALALLPPIVRSMAVREVAFLVVGFSSWGWTSSSTFAGADGVVKRRVVVLGPRTTVRLLLHEAAHCWHSKPPWSRHPGLGMAVSTQGEQALRELPGMAELMDSYVRDDDTLAESLALCWLLRPTAGKVS